MRYHKQAWGKRGAHHGNHGVQGPTACAPASHVSQASHVASAGVSFLVRRLLIVAAPIAQFHVPINLFPVMMMFHIAVMILPFSCVHGSISMSD